MGYNLKQNYATENYQHGKQSNTYSFENVYLNYIEKDGCRMVFRRSNITFAFVLGDFDWNVWQLSRNRDTYR